MLSEKCNKINFKFLNYNKTKFHLLIKNIYFRFNYYCSQSNGKLDFLDIDKILRNIFKI